MKLRLGRTRTALIVAPHPDDEVIGAFGLIRALLRRGVRVHVLVVSDGAASHPGSARWPTTRLATARRLEARRALRRAGLHAGLIEHLGLPDGALATLVRRDWRPLDRAMMRRALGSCLIVGPSPGDAHPDHVAVARALASTPTRRARRLAYRVWPAGEHARGRVHGIAVEGGTLAKRSVLRLYRTQTGAITDSPTGFAMSRNELARFSRPVELFEALR